MPSPEEEVTAAARHRAAALAARDEDALRRLMHPGLLWTTFRGEVLGYEAYIAGNTRGGLRWRAQHLDDVTVSVAGDTAVLAALVTDEVTRDGRDQSFRLRLTQAWVRTPEGWRCLAGHASAPLRVLGARCAGVFLHRRAEPDHVAVGIDEDALVLAPLGVLREPDVAAGREPGLGQRVGVRDEQVGRGPPVGPLIEVRLHAEVDLGALEGDIAVPAAVPVADAEPEPAVIGKGSDQVTDGEDRRYSRTHHCNLPCAVSRRQGCRYLVVKSKYTRKTRSARLRPVSVQAAMSRELVPKFELSPGSLVSAIKLSMKPACKKFHKSDVLFL
jgi:ketosteroid isomerase-like protein